MKIIQPNNFTNSQNSTCQELKRVMSERINISWKQSTITNDISPQNYTLGCTLTLLTQKIVTNGIFACCHVVCHPGSSLNRCCSVIADQLLSSNQFTAPVHELLTQVLSTESLDSTIILSSYLFFYCSYLALISGRPPVCEGCQPVSRSIVTRHQGRLYKERGGGRSFGQDQAIILITAMGHLV